MDGNLEKGNMRTPETNLLGIACHVIGSLKLTVDDLRLSAYPLDFSNKVKGRVFEHVKMMNPEKLGWIIVNAIEDGKPTPFRKISVAEVEGLNNYIQWTGKEARKELGRMASSVVIAAMYEILATNLRLRIDAGAIPRLCSSAGNYQPTSAMTAFVRRQLFPKPSRVVA